MKFLQNSALAIEISGVFFALATHNFPLYLLICCPVTIFCYALDKYTAKHKSLRLSEVFLMVLALIGGAVPALFCMVILHHKTKKFKFLLSVLFLALIQILLIGYFS